MRNAVVTLLVLVCGPLLMGSCPSRTKNYVAGQVINPSHVTENEDNLYNYTCAGVDTYANNSLPTAALQDVSVTTAKLASGAVTSAIVADNAITSTDILDGTIASADILDGTIVSADITDGTVVSADIADGTIVAADLASGALPVADRVQRTAGDVTTSSTTHTNFTGASITMTTGANPVLMGFRGTCLCNNAACVLRFRFEVDGTSEMGSGATSGQYFEVDTATNGYICSFTMLTQDLSAGSHTFGLEWRVDDAGHTATMECDTEFPCDFYAVEVSD